MPVPKCGSKQCVIWGCATFLLAAVVSAYFFCPWFKSGAKPCCKEHAAASQLSMDAEAMATLNSAGPPAEEEMSVEDEVENIYVLIQQMNAREYTTMDTMIRIFHYVKPHKGPTRGCPECAEIHDRSKNTGMVTITQERFNRMLELEKNER